MSFEKSERRATRATTDLLGSRRRQKKKLAFRRVPPGTSKTLSLAHTGGTVAAHRDPNRRFKARLGISMLK